MISPQLSNDDERINNHLQPARLEAILAAGALDAIRENQRFGLPVVAERGGQIVYIDAFEAEAELLKNFPELATKGLSSPPAIP